MQDEIEHVVIRRPKFVAGSYDKPEVGVFVQTNKKMNPLRTELFKPGQTVWMKWSGGPIVARSRIRSWHNGNTVQGNINEIRDLTKGTELFGLDDYWNSVAEKSDVFYTVVRLMDEEWLKDLLYPTARTFGSSWVYLRTAMDRDSWLGNKNPPIKDIPKGRTIPVSLRFEVLRRDSFTCKYCGRRAPEVELHVDHLKPWIETQKHDINNLVTACKDCNIGKGMKHI